MTKGPKFRKDGQLDNRGHSDGSKLTQFAENDGRKRPGRSKGAKSLKSVYQAIGEIPVKADINGKPKRITTKEGIVLKERHQALQGDHRAREHFLKRLAEYSPIEVEPDRTGVLLAEDEELLASAFERGLLGVLPLVNDAESAVPKSTSLPDDDAADGDQP